MNQLNVERIKIEQMYFDDVQKYIVDIKDFIYESVKMSNYEDSYSIDQAAEKANELCGYVRDDKAIVLGAFYEESMVGFLQAYSYPFREDANRLYIGIVHVLDEYRNIHIGAELLSTIESVAKIKGYNRLFLHAEATNDKACRFYEKNNFNKERIQYVKDIG